MNLLKAFCEENNINYETDKPSSEFSTFKIGGIAPIVVSPSSYDMFKLLLCFMKNNSIEYLTVGRCSNILFPDSTLNFAVIKTDNLNEMRTDGEKIICGAGVPLSKVASFAQQNGLTGMESLFGIPGSVGGAVYMNAGAYGNDISHIAIETKCVNNDGILSTVIGENHHFGYRKSVFQENGSIVLESTFKLSYGNKDEILKEMNGYMEKRTLSQPLNYPSAGSVFKRPEGFYAGKLIEDCGLKGYSVGDACVSEKHAGFIVNKGKATASDVKKLISHIQNTVLDKFGVLLEPEIRIY